MISAKNQELSQCGHFWEKYFHDIQLSRTVIINLSLLCQRNITASEGMFAMEDELLTQQT